MIIMINGAFGVGKTTIAYKLKDLIPNSMIFDPEEIGYMLRNIITEEVRNEDEQTDNFQDIALWKVLTVTVAEQLNGKYQRNLIIPMTIFNKQYFEYIYNGFCQIDKNTYHFCLRATEQTIHQRLRMRNEVEGSWAYHQTHACLQAFKDDCFNEFIDTEALSIDEIVERIIAKIRKGNS